MIASFSQAISDNFIAGVLVVVVVGAATWLGRKIDKHVVEPVREIPHIRETQLATSLDVKKVKAELFPNHGSSLRDSVDRNEVITRETAARVDGLTTVVDEHVAADSLMWEKIDSALKGLSTGQADAAQTAVDVAEDLRNAG